MKGKVIRDQCDCWLCKSDGDAFPWRGEVATDGVWRFRYHRTQRDAFAWCMRELERIAKAGAA